MFLKHPLDIDIYSDYMFICFLSVKQMLGIFVTYPQKHKRRLGYEHRDVLKRKGVGAHEFLKAFFFVQKRHRYLFWELPPIHIFMDSLLFCFRKAIL